MSVITWVFTLLITGFAIGLVLGVIILRMDRHRKRSSRTLSIKDGITLQYDCSSPGIYERIREVLDGK
jgi:hypothetical protein